MLRGDLRENVQEAFALRHDRVQEANPASSPFPVPIRAIRVICVIRAIRVIRGSNWGFIFGEDRQRSRGR
jgi:hypothetical protein